MKSSMEERNKREDEDSKERLRRIKLVDQRQITNYYLVCSTRQIHLGILEVPLRRKYAA